MPNNMAHRMRVFGDAQRLRSFVKKYIKTYRGKEDKYEYLDFDAIIPMPKELREDKVDSRGEIGYDAWYGKDWSRILEWPWVIAEKIVTRKGLQKFLDKQDPEYKKQANKVRDNIRKYGAPDSLEWAVKNWGTKWNSYDLNFILNVGPRDWGTTQIEFVFFTAWSPPIPVIEMLAYKEPEIRIEIVGYEGGMNFGCKGSFEGGHGSYECTDATPELYEEVFGEKPHVEEEDEAES